MILKRLLNSQVLNLIKEFKRKHENIWDIAIYGSLIRGKINARDLDLAIIFTKANLNERLELAQELKQKLKKTHYNVDTKGIGLNDLLDKNFLARQAIISEGYLIARKKKLCELFGFGPYYIFSYSLKNLSQSKKIMFQYALKGRRGQKGILELKGLEHLGSGVIKVPLENSEEFKEFLEKNNIIYQIYKGLFY